MIFLKFFLSLIRNKSWKINELLRLPTPGLRPGFLPGQHTLATITENCTSKGPHKPTVLCHFDCLQQVKKNTDIIFSQRGDGNKTHKHNININTC